MNRRVPTGLLARTLIASAILGLSAPIALPPNLAVAAQRRGGGRAGGGGHAFGGGRSFGGGAVHARREVVRTPNFVQRSGRTFEPARTPARSFGSRPQSFQDRGNPGNRGGMPGNRGEFTGRRFGVEGTPDRMAARQFTRSHGERHYDNGLVLHGGIHVTSGWERHYFPGGYCHFPYYASGFGLGAYISPFGCFFGVCCPFISASCCLDFPPPVAYIDVPVYNGPVCEGFESEPGANLLDSPDLDVTEPGLVNAMDELTEAFQNGNIDALATLVSPSVDVAIYEQGQYKYSLSADNYMNLARDAIQNTHTVSFDITDLQQRSPNVFVVSGKQTYTDRNGNTRSVYFSDALQDYYGHWTLCQVGTAPDRIQNYG